MLYITALENLKAKEFIGTHDISKLNQEEINDFTSSITINEIKAVKKTSSNEKGTRLNKFITEFYQNSK